MQTDLESAAEGIFGCKPKSRQQRGIGSGTRAVDLCDANEFLDLLLGLGHRGLQASDLYAALAARLCVARVCASRVCACVRVCMRVT